LIEASLRPRGPYSLRLSTRHGSDATRVAAGGVLRAVYEMDGRLEIGEARQQPDGAVVLRAPSEETIERLRFTLGVEDDHSEFVRRFSRDPFLGATVRRLKGMRPPRCATVTQSLLRALCGQLITARRAREIERRVVRAATPSLDGLHAAPTPAAMGRYSPAELRALGLGGPRASALVRLCRSLDLERLREVSTDAAAARLVRESRIGPWSVGVVCLQGLGRYERGLVGDLGLIKLLARMRGRPVESWETAELLEPYAEWAGLASVYMLAGLAQGTIDVSAPLAA
jgi:AraC family transcriptional regulator, regulatory protein of adaptative response / DNA-3-methyladenine glycosylase II